MAWVLLDDNFNNHPKAVQAGPVACWLYTCGLMYCRKHHTDGFIPKRAVGTLGVTTNTKRLEALLVDVRLWEPADGGYRVHDYHAIYESDAALKAEKEARREQKRAAGKLGGQASWQSRSKPPTAAEAELKQTTSKPEAPVLNPIRDGLVRSGSEVLVERGSGKTTDPPFDEWLLELQTAYPNYRVTRNIKTEQAFMGAMLREPNTPFVNWALLMENLEQNKVSHEWRVKRMVPSLENYLVNGLWLNVHPPDPPAAEQVSPRTARMLS